MPPFSRLRTCVLAAAFSLTAAGALTAAPQQHAPDAHMSVSLYQGKALSFNEQIGAVFVAQPSIASYQVVGNRKVVVFGSYPGKTSLMVLGTDGRTLYNGLVEVAYDVSSMEMALKSSFPKLKLQLVALNDGVAVRGKVETAQEAANVVAFLDAKHRWRRLMCRLRDRKASRKSLVQLPVPARLAHVSAKSSISSP